MARRKRKGNFDFDFSSLSFTDPDNEQIKQAVPHLSLKPVMFDNAVNMANEIDYTKDYFAFVSGTFIFGDFIEALCFTKHLDPSVMYVSTLGMSKENIDSLVNLTMCLRCEKLNLLISNYYMGVERHNNVPYFEQEFAGQPIDVAVLASHCKCALIRSRKGDILITGSANLSSSNNVEQFVILHDSNLLDFVQGKFEYIFDRFTVYHGLDHKPHTDWSKNKGNTGKLAYEALQKGGATL